MNLGQPKSKAKGCIISHCQCLGLCTCRIRSKLVQVSSLRIRYKLVSSLVSSRNFDTRLQFDNKLQYSIVLDSQASHDCVTFTGDDYVDRGFIVASVDTKCAEESAQGAKGTMCYCSTDLCNAAVKPSSTPLYTVIFTTAVALVSAMYFG
jgi:hypothetical protein